MNAKYRRLRTKFEPDTRFELKPVSRPPFRVVLDDAFDRLKARLLAESLGSAWQSELSSEVRRAANEAAGLARLTAYPLLVFPVLFEEKAEESLRKAASGKRRREQNCDLILL